jgi:protein-disulfide isomerase
MNPESEAKPTDLPVNPPPADASQSKAAYADPSAVIVIPRVVLNYVVIGIVMFGVGMLAGGAAVNAVFNANSAENKQLVQSAVDSAIEARGGVQAGEQVGLQPGQRYQVSADDDPVLGDANAPITIVEFSDFHCPYCGRFFAETLQPLMTNYEGRIKLVYRDYPILGQSSVVAALAAGCMNDQGKFWDFHNKTFANQQDLTREAFVSYAQDLGADVGKFTNCLDNQEHIQEITADATYAQNLGVTGTPAFFVNGRFISGAQPYSVFASVIDEELGKLEESTPEPIASTS